MSILIAYYTWSGNTKRIAELIKAETGGTLFEILPKDGYGIGLKKSAYAERGRYII